MALALYRRYRPATFAEVVGQEHVTQPLAQAVSSGRINHAYLFSGPRGCGKTSTARILARSLNCEKGPTPEPCGACDSCRDLAPDGPGNVDVIEIDAASHGGVDDARDLRERAFQLPVRGRYKVYIIDEAHMVTTQGFNALLKVVEEPPESVIFIFATTEPDKVLSTIRSRTHHYPFRLMPPSTMRGLLERICGEEGVVVEPTVFPLVTRAGGGSARDSLSLLDQLLSGAEASGVTYARAVALLGVTDAALLDEMVDALGAADGAAVFGAIERVVDAGHDPRRFGSDLLERLRDLIVIDAVPDAIAKGILDHPADQLERMVDQAARLGTATLSRLADIVHTGLTEMRGTTSPRLLLELVCARMLLPATSSDSSAVLQRLERLERRFDIDGAAEDPAAPARPAAAVSTPAGDGAASARAAAPAVAAKAPAESAATPPPVASPPPAARAKAAPAKSAPNEDVPTRDAPAAQAPAAEPPAPAPAAPDSVTGDPIHRPSADWATPAAPAATPAPPAAATTAGGVDAAAVRRLWPDLLERVKQRKRTTHALLMNATAASVEGNVLTLAIGSAGLMRRLSDDMNTEVLRGALKDLLGVDWKIRTVVTDEGESGPRGSGGTPSRSAAPEPDPRDEEPPDPDPGGGPPAPPRDPETEAINLLQSQLGARTIAQSDG